MLITKELENLTKYYNFANEQYTPFYCGLYGSQNYLIATDNSDTDSKILIVPSLKDAVLKKEVISKEYEKDTGKILVQDIRKSFDSMLKMNINFLEILYTDYWVANPLFLNEVYYLRENADLIANSNPLRLLQCTFGMAHTTKKKELNGKRVSTIYRSLVFAKNYLQTNSFYDSLFMTGEERELALEYKTKAHNYNELLVKSFEYMKELQQILDTAKSIYKNEKDNNAKEFLDDLAFSIIKKGDKLIG